MNINAKIIAEEMKKHLLNEIMPFWEKRDIDSEYGGYFTCFNREGILTDENKYVWFQGRQLYVYSLLYNKIEKRPLWLEKAKCGYDFLVKHAYSGNGRWYYKLNRKGDVLIGLTSIYADYHVAQGLAEYMVALNNASPEGIQILNDTYDALERNTCDSRFKEIYENTWSPVFIWNDMYLTALDVANITTEALGNGRTKALINECSEKIMHWFARDEYQLVLEAISRDNKVILEGEGRFVNPGHSFESARFLMDTGEKQKNQKMIERALEIIQWTYRVGWDDKNGGIFSYLDVLGGNPIPLDWHKATNSQWNDKVWWVNAEALCAFSKAYVLSDGNNEYLDMLTKQWSFCLDKFYDSVSGEWYERLYPDSSVKVADKGTPWKCAFHLVRSLVMAIQSLEKME